MLLVHGDVTDADRMAEVVIEVVERFGELHGVVHAAGVVDDALLVTKTPSAVEEVLGPKVYGTLELEAAAAGTSLDLFVVISSTSAEIAPIGQVDYVAANSFLNAFAASRQRGGRHSRACAGLGRLERGRHGRGGRRPTLRRRCGARAGGVHPPVLRRADRRSAWAWRD